MRGLCYRDDDKRHRQLSDNRIERGFPPVTPDACERDSILSALFDDLMSKVTFLLAEFSMLILFCFSHGLHGAVYIKFFITFITLSFSEMSLVGLALDLVV